VITDLVDGGDTGNRTGSPRAIRKRWCCSLGVALAAAISASALTASSAAAESRPASGVVDAVAVASQQLAYESNLIDLTLPRLTPLDAAAALRVREATASLGPTLATDLHRWGVTPAAAASLWEARIGDGGPPPDEAEWTCSLRAQETHAEDLATTPAPSLAAELGTIELTLLVEGRQLATEMTSLPHLAAPLDEDQRDALHLLVPLLLPTDRSFAASA
jgi:hypothetical protein